MLSASFILPNRECREYRIRRVDYCRDRAINYRKCLLFIALSKMWAEQGVSARKSIPCGKGDMRCPILSQTAVRLLQNGETLQTVESGAVFQPLFCAISEQGGGSMRRRLSSRRANRRDRLYTVRSEQWVSFAASFALQSSR